MAKAVAISALDALGTGAMGSSSPALAEVHSISSASAETGGGGSGDGGVLGLSTSTLDQYVVHGQERQIGS